MPKLHWLRENQRASATTVAGEKTWDWCSRHLGDLRYLSAVDKPPSLRRSEGEARPNLVPFRGAEYVVLELEEEQAGKPTGYYLSSITPGELQDRLLHDLPTEIRNRMASGLLPRRLLFDAAGREQEGPNFRTSNGEPCDACGGNIPAGQQLYLLTHAGAQATSGVSMSGKRNVRPGSTSGAADLHGSSGGR
jgi:hypothetical protein